MNILEGLNNKQQKAVTAIDGRIKVVAGAGSGKTKTIAHRYAYLVEEVGINPANILCLTFTNKAAQEMKQRIAKMVHAGNYNDFVSTIHGFCVKLLRREIHRIGYPSTFTILDDEDMKLLAKEVMVETGENRTQETVKQFLAEIGITKAQTPYIDMYLVPESLKQKDYSDIENKSGAFYLFLMKQQKAYSIDFNDIINIALYLLDRFDDVKKYWQKQFDYVIVDETQDCNRKDWALLNILTETNNNLFVVGDPDQAIYEWRGADTSLFVNFECDQEIILDENYRSTQSILNVANSIIEKNKNRIEKNLYTRRKETSNVIHYHEKSEQEEAGRVTNEIIKLHKTGIAFSDIAILFRSTSLSRSIEQELMKNKIQYVIYGGIRFFERKEIKDALSYLRLLCSEDDLSFTRILNVPSRKLGDAFKKKLAVVAEKDGTNLYRTLVNHIGDKEFSKPSAVNFVSIIEEAKQRIATLSISDLLCHILKASGYEELLRLDEDVDRQENLKELIASIIEYERINIENEVTLNNYLQDIALYTNMDYKNDVDGTVKLMTIHQSKGLEFPYVFVIGLSEGTLPSLRSIRERRESALEEERRLMYVAITRAEKALYLTESEGYNFATKTDKYPSRFLTEIKRDFFVTEGIVTDDLWNGTKNMISRLDNEIKPKSNNRFRISTKVLHQIFGEGTILSYNSEQDSYQVQFENGVRNVIANKLNSIHSASFERTSNVITDNNIESSDKINMLLKDMENLQNETNVEKGENTTMFVDIEDLQSLEKFFTSLTDIKKRYIHLALANLKDIFGRIQNELSSKKCSIRFPKTRSIWYDENFKVESNSDGVSGQIEVIINNYQFAIECYYGFDDDFSVRETIDIVHYPVDSSYVEKMVVGYFRKMASLYSISEYKCDENEYKSLVIPCKPNNIYNCLNDIFDKLSIYFS